MFAILCCRTRSATLGSAAPPLAVIALTSVVMACGGAGVTSPLGSTPGIDPALAIEGQLAGKLVCRAYRVGSVSPGGGRILWRCVVGRREGDSGLLGAAALVRARSRGGRSVLDWGTGLG